MTMVFVTLNEDKTAITTYYGLSDPKLENSTTIETSDSMYHAYYAVMLEFGISAGMLPVD